jgi:hypothetical protein
MSERTLTGRSVVVVGAVALVALGLARTSARSPRA